MTIAAARTSETETTHRARVPEGSRVEPNRRVVENRSDDEILGLLDEPRHKGSDGADGLSDELSEDQSSTVDGDTADAIEGSPQEDLNEDTEPEALREIFDAKPELRQAWQDAREYREVFATPTEARRATALIGDLNRLDALFFSSRIEDQAELAKSIATLDPKAFASFAKAINVELGKRGRTNDLDLKEPVAPNSQARKKKQDFLRRPSANKMIDAQNHRRPRAQRKSFFKAPMPQWFKVWSIKSRHRLSGCCRRERRRRRGTEWWAGSIVN